MVLKIYVPDLSQVQSFHSQNSQSCSWNFFLISNRTNNFRVIRSKIGHKPSFDVFFSWSALPLKKTFCLVKSRVISLWYILAAENNAVVLVWEDVFFIECTSSFASELDHNQLQIMFDSIACNQRMNEKWEKEKKEKSEQ